MSSFLEASSTWTEPYLSPPFSLSTCLVWKSFNLTSLPAFHCEGTWMCLLARWTGTWVLYSFPFAMRLYNADGLEWLVNREWSAIYKNLSNYSKDVMCNNHLSFWHYSPLEVNDVINILFSISCLKLDIERSPIYKIGTSDFLQWEKQQHMFKAFLCHIAVRKSNEVTWTSRG